MSAAFPPDSFGPRYEIIAELGRGAASCVYEVHDRVHDVRRALKLAARRGQLRRLRREFACLTSLRHPNIVRAYDYGETASGQPYFTMELVRGVPFSSVAGRHEPEVAAALALQILDALAALHARGFVHRDLKPKNILVVGKGAGALVRLIDFGLITPIGGRATAAGTLPYMAPEVARGEIVDGTADLYSLGVLLYEALVPDGAARTLEEVARRFSEAPSPPHRHNPLVSEALSTLVLRLCAPARTARLPDALAAATALAKVPGLGLTRAPERGIIERLMRGGAVSHRRGKLAPIKRAALAVRDSGEGRLVVVEGPFGVGKTPFLRELAVQLSFMGLRVVRARVDGSAAAPIPALLRAARGIALDSQLDGLAAGTFEEAEVHGRLVPALLRTFTGRPTAVLVDDLHQAEGLGLELLRGLAGGVRLGPMLLVCAGDPRSDGVVLHEALEALPHERVYIGPLCLEEVAQLAAQRLHGLRLPAPALDRITRDTHGMPRLVERTLARLLADGTIQHQDSAFTFVGGRYRPARHGELELVAARIALVPESLRALLGAAAVLGVELDPTSLAAVADVESSTAAAALGELLRLEILEPGSATQAPTYKFASRAVLAAVYDALEPDGRARLHDRAAALVATDASRRPKYVEHLVRGSDDTRAIAAALDAADEAAHSLAYRRALDFYTRAFERAGKHGAVAAAIALRAGRLCERKGELEHAATWYEEAEHAGLPTPAEALEAALGRAGIELTRGLRERAQGHLARAASLAVPGVPLALLGRYARLRARSAVRAGRVEEVSVELEGLVRQLDQAGEGEEAALVLLELARLGRERGELGQAVRHARRALQRARAVGSPVAAQASAALGRGWLDAGRMTLARRALVRALRLARQQGDRAGEALAQRELGNVRFRAGEYDAALRRYARALELSRVGRSRTDEIACSYRIGIARARKGELRPALIALQAALEQAIAHADDRQAGYAALELGHTHLLVGDFDAALAALELAGGYARGLDDAILELRAEALAEWRLLALGVAGHPHELVQRTLGRLEETRLDTVGLYYAGRCAVLCSEPAVAVRLARAFQSTVVRGRRRDYIARSALLLGEADLRTHDREAALRHLAAAADAASRSGERLVEIAARYRLGECFTGHERGVRELVRAMELLREVAQALPPTLATAHLEAAPAPDLRRAFARARQWLLLARASGEGSLTTRNDLP